jgi:hypothetical protein
VRAWFKEWPIRLPKTSIGPQRLVSAQDPILKLYTTIMLGAECQSCFRR